MAQETARDQSRQRQSPKAYQLKITLSDSVPDIWRRVLVPAHITLAELHDILQHTMGWESQHDYGFHQGVSPQKSSFETEQVLSAVLAEIANSPLYYLYDFKGGWLHRIEVEALEVGADTSEVPTCLAGAEACPIENSGGVWGYDELMERLDDPSDPEYMDLIEKYGSFDPGAFSVADVNDRLRAHSSRPTKA
ncbi:MAG: plasmid pRiA4b ORF-3 family protein [Cyanobacteria bacterium J06649_5]